MCRSCVTVIARLASTHTALVSQSLVGLCFAFPSINQSIVWLTGALLSSPVLGVRLMTALQVLQVPLVGIGRKVKNSPTPSIDSIARSQKGTSASGQGGPH